MQHHNKDSNYEPTDITFTLCDVSCRWFSETLMAAQYNATSRDAFSLLHALLTVSTVKNNPNSEHVS